MGVVSSLGMMESAARPWNFKSKNPKMMIQSTWMLFAWIWIMTLVLMNMTSQASLEAPQGRRRDSGRQSMSAAAQNLQLLFWWWRPSLWMGSALWSQVISSIILLGEFVSTLRIQAPHCSTPWCSIFFHSVSCKKPLTGRHIQCLNGMVLASSGWFFWGHANLVSRSCLRPMWSTPKSCWICGRIALTTTGLTREQLDQPGSATSSDVHHVRCVSR